MYKRYAASVISTELIHTCYYTLGKNSKFVVAKRCVCGGFSSTLSVANRNRLGLVRSRCGFHIESPLAHSRTELMRTGHSRA